VLLRLGVTVLLGHTKVDNVDNIGALGAWTANEKVVGLDVAVDEVLLVDCLNS
jgi:predicted ATP-grasp superfamily ATP-dependent carboligase